MKAALSEWPQGEPRDPCPAAVSWVLLSQVALSYLTSCLLITSQTWGDPAKQREMRENGALVALKVIKDISMGKR